MLKSLELAFRGSGSKFSRGRIPPDLPTYVAPSALVCSAPPPPPTLNSCLSLCITNFIVQIIVLSGPSKPGNTDSVSQNLKKIREAYIPGLPHFRVCPPHFLERIVALGCKSTKNKDEIIETQFQPVTLTRK